MGKGITNFRYLLTGILLAVFALFLSTCAPAELTELNTASVTLNTGINPAASRAAQADVASFSLSVTADGMTTVEQSFTGDSVSLEIEAGPARTFTLQALDADDNVLFSGSKTMDLTAGEDADLVIELGYAGFYVTFVTNGGSALPMQYVEKDEPVTIPAAPTKTGYNLTGWFTDSGLTQAWNTSSDGVVSDLTLYAKWTVKSYSIIFYGNEATGGAMMDQSVSYNETVSLSSNAFIKDSLHFSGWNTESDGSGDSYSDGGSYKHTIDDDIILYAQWDSYLARWTFDGTIDDETGNYNATGTPSYIAANPGNGLTQSLSFNGSYMLSVPPIDLGDQFSLSVWVYYSGGSTINTILSNNSDTGNSDGFKLYINYWNTSDQKLYINTGDGTNQADTTSDPNTVSVGSWHHVVFTLDKANSVGEIYLDNVSVGSGSILNTFATNTDLKIGGVDYSSGVFFFNGYMSDMRVYSGILSPIEISSIYGDTEAPSGYSVSFDQSVIDYGNNTAVSFTFAGAEVGTTYEYTIDDFNLSTPAVTGSGAVTSATQQITGIDVSSLDDDTLTLSVTLTDSSANTGTSATDTAPHYKFTGGDGSIGTPYQIANAYQLNNLRYFIGPAYDTTYFELTANIDLTTFVSLGGYQYNSGQGWEPIGGNSSNDSTTRFMGSFDGNGYVINNIMINRTSLTPTTDVFGLFGYVENGNIQDVGIVGGSVQISASSGSSFGSGPLAGVLSGSTVSGSYSDVSVTGTGSAQRFGGLIGELRGSASADNCYAEGDVSNVTGRVGGFTYLLYSSSVATDCYSTGTITVTGTGEYAGGFAGVISNGTSSAIRCYATGNIIAADSAQVGGFCGRSWGYSHIEDSYARGNVTGSDQVGGFLGHIEFPGSAPTYRSFSTGAVSGSTNVGGFAGSESSSVADNFNCYWDTETSGQASSAGTTPTGETTTNMKLQGTYTGWDFTGVWDIDGSTNDGYPFLR